VYLQYHNKNDTKNKEVLSHGCDRCSGAVFIDTEMLLAVLAYL